MKNKLVFLLASAVLVCGMTFCQNPQKPTVAEEVEKLESFLTEAEIAEVDRETESGRTGGWDVVLEQDGVRHKARFKHLDKHRPRFLPDSYQYELAAYALNRMLSQTIIPPMVPRTIDGVKGSLQIFLEACFSESDYMRRDQEPPDPLLFQRAKVLIQIFELLTADECHDQEDTLIQTENWKLCRIDFSEAFDPEPTLNPNCTISNCSRSLYKALKALTKDDLKAKLGVYLNSDELEGLWHRAGLICARLDELIRLNGEDKILFDF
jgi:hypothetical protein